MGFLPYSREHLESLAAHGAASYYVGDHIALCRILGRIPCYVDTRDSSVAPWMMLHGFWESWITLELDRLIQPGMRVVDAGANMGYFTLAFAAAVGDRGRVLSIEANPELVPLIRRSALLNGFASFVELRNVALTAKSGQKARLVAPSDNMGGASIHHQPQEGVPSFEVETASLDDLVADWDRVDLVKIDIEGAEQQAWAGMRKTVERCPDIKIAMEFGANRYAKPAAFLASMRAAGFVVKAIEPHGIVTVPDEHLLDESRWWMLLLHR